MTDPFRYHHSDDIVTVASRRKRFLEALNWGLLFVGAWELVILPFVGQTILPFAIALVTFVTFITVRFLLRRGMLRAACMLFPAVVDVGLFVIFLFLAEAIGVRQAIETETSSLMIMGLAVLFAGALVDPRAPFFVAFVNSVLLVIIVRSAGTEDPRFSIHFFWWLLALVSWLYERTLRDAFGRLSTARRDLQTLVEERTAELSRTVNRLSQAKAALETSNRELDAFASAVSHDLRAPARAVIGFADALHEEHASELGPAGMEHLGRVRRAGRRMDALIEDLLRLSRVVRPEVRLESVDVAAVARGIVEELRRGEPGRLVDYHAPEQLHVVGDRRLVQVLLENLLANAWKFTRPRAESRVELGEDELDSRGARVIFVRDNGVGFDMEYAEKLFRPFQRLHSISEFDGTGIGLATAQRIVHRHGGRIWAEARVDEGASFFFTLGAPEQEQEQEQEVQVDGESSPGLS